MIGSLNLSQTQWARNVVQVSAAVCGEERCVMRQITAAWETTPIAGTEQLSQSTTQTGEASVFPV